MNATTKLPLLPLALAWACQGPADEYRAALPDRATLEVQVPAESTQGLTRAHLVGGPADLYRHTYYAARDINNLGRLVVELVTTIAEYPPTQLALEQAVWGPFSEPREPNEFKLVVQKVSEPLHYVWAISGRPKGQNDFTTLAAGAFEPAQLEDYGRGWFILDFDVIGALDPTEAGRGHIYYAFERGEGGTEVAAYFDSPQAQVAYRYGEDRDGAGYVTFAVPGDIHDDPAQGAPENLVILSRWQANGAGRADVSATGGDVEGQVYGVQCWDERFISTFEAYAQNQEVWGRAGAETACVLAAPEAPRLPTAAELVSPYPLP